MLKISVVRDKLVSMTTLALAATVPIPQNVLAFWPKSITANMLPLFVVSVGAAQYDFTSAGSERFSEPRLYSIYGFIAEGMLGINSEAERACEDHLYQLQDYFVANRRVEAGTPPLALHLEPVGDNGIETYNRYDAIYTGFRFDIRAGHVRRITFAGV